MGNFSNHIRWKGEQRARLVTGSGVEVNFDSQQASLLSSEDAFMAAVNTSFLSAFLWAANRLHLRLILYECQAEAIVQEDLERVEWFSEIHLFPTIRVAAGGETHDVVVEHTQRALQAAHKFSLIANSIKATLVVEPRIEVF
ncbi:MAG TPA: hypothetical protein PKW33_02200 [Anaerolineaceae bacterium]|nr:hypothetical protein [Anaerolineaceae bacterium]HPN50372.1 hypothetical protein [Anaerolineaceae bacterium]